MTAITETLTPPATQPVAAPVRSERYAPAVIEQKWRERWQRDELYRVDDNAPGEKWYSLTMYPYPSGVLHIGHWYAFVIPDVFARLQRMRGYNVLFPMGFDAFGLPAENAAIRNNIHPATWTFDNIATMRAPVRQMGAMIDWSREVITCTPEYYRWNQWIFLQMLEQGLAYRAKGAVWWCPKDQTVLANEQVLDGQHLRALRHGGLQARPGAVVLPHHRLRRGAAARHGGAGLAGARQDDAAQLDRPLRRGPPALHAGDGRCPGSLHHPSRHGLGRYLHGVGAGAPAGGEDHRRPSASRGRRPTSSRRGGRPRSSGCRPTSPAPGRRLHRRRTPSTR